MLDIQEQLSERYRSLRDSRVGPVFFIEHGLREDEVEDLTSSVRNALVEHPLGSGWWESRSLPIIVVTTEVGYRYRGSGTDFWPILGQELNSHVHASDRKHIRDLFVSAAETYRGANPPATPWAEAFRIIAWPITHALFPIEFHRPLAGVLANLRRSLNGLNDDALYHAIRFSASNSTARFSAFLESPNLIVALVRNILGEKDSDLCGEIVQRIESDLKADKVARRSVLTARRIQATTQKVPERTTDSGEPTRSVVGNLQLRRRYDLITLEASFPLLEGDLGVRLRRALRRRRFAPSLWGASGRVPSEQILSGVPFPVKLTSMPRKDSPLLPGVENLEIDNDLRRTLAAFQLELTLPFVFAVSADNKVAKCVRGANISGRRKYWVLVGSESESLLEFQRIADLGPLSCYELDPESDKSAVQALVDMGFRVRFGVSVSFAGAPTIDRYAPIPTFAVGDERFVVPEESGADSLTVESLGNVVRAGTDELVRMVVAEGENVVSVGNGAEVREFSFRGMHGSATSPPVVCEVIARSSELTVQELLSGRLSFDIEGHAPLEGLSLLVEVQAAGRKISAVAPLGMMPQTISSEHEPFATLLDEPTREVLAHSQSVVIQLSIGNLCAQSWVLGHRVRSCWWERHPDGGQALFGELGELPYGVVPETTPHMSPVSASEESNSEVHLLAPCELDTQDYGVAANFTTLCVSPAQMHLQGRSTEKPRLVRRRRGDDGRRAAGLEDLMEAYLRWAHAESENLVAEIRRRQVVVEIDRWISEICCGENWRKREACIPDKDPWQLLIEKGNKRGLGRDAYVTVEEDVWFGIFETIVWVVKQEIPELWSLVRNGSNLLERDWLIVEAACDEAYLTVTRDSTEAGNVELADIMREADPSADFDRGQWQAVFQDVLAQSDLAMLGELLLPTDSASALMSLDPSRMSYDNLADELFGWATEWQKALVADVPNKDKLKTIIVLWVEPAAAVSQNWRTVLDTLLVDRSIARASRYLALRSRHGMGGGDS